mmetsp:Transcript_23254/g.64955  ORF Transcript_23254/g.64955 Transcript_23254/m.64955 type:complete len:682 (+) Transcript_23254:57-2102(+)
MSTTPTLTLHSCHIHDSGVRGLRPIDAGPDLNVVGDSEMARILKGSVEKVAQAKDTASQASLGTASVDLSKPGYLTISATSCIEVLLLWAMVVSAPCMDLVDLPKHVIAVMPRSAYDFRDEEPIVEPDGHVWYFTVSDSEALQDVLLRMGCCGAVRCDFEAAYASRNNHKLGRGHEGTVVAADELGTGAKHAAKMMASTVISKDVCREASALLRAQGHPNIAGFRGVFINPDNTDNNWTMVMDMYPDSLTKALERSGLWTEEATLDVVGGLFAGIAHLHSRGIVHRDVKLDNILLDEHEEAVLCDFGFSASVHDSESMKVKCGTPGYMAPEMVGESGIYGEKVDVFAAGVVHYALISKTVPFASTDIRMSIQRTLACKPKFEEPSWLRISADTQKLVGLLLTKKPEHRPTSAEALAKIVERSRNVSENLKDSEFTDNKVSTFVGTVTTACPSTWRTHSADSGIEAEMNGILGSGSADLRTVMVPEGPKAPPIPRRNRRLSRDGIIIRPPSVGSEPHDFMGKDHEEDVGEGSKSSAAPSANTTKDSGDRKDLIARSRRERFCKAMSVYDDNAKAISNGRKKGLTDHQQRSAGGMSAGGRSVSGSSASRRSASSAASSRERSISTASRCSVTGQLAEMVLPTCSRLPSIANVPTSDVEQPLESRRAFSKGGRRISTDSRLVSL